MLKLFGLGKQLIGNNSVYLKMTYHSYCPRVSSIGRGFVSRTPRIYTTWFSNHRNHDLNNYFGKLKYIKKIIQVN